MNPRMAKPCLSLQAVYLHFLDFLGEIIVLVSPTNKVLFQQLFFPFPPLLYPYVLTSIHPNLPFRNTSVTWKYGMCFPFQISSAVHIWIHVQLHLSTDCVFNYWLNLINKPSKGTRIVDTNKWTPVVKVIYTIFGHELLGNKGKKNHPHSEYSFKQELTQTWPDKEHAHFCLHWSPRITRITDCWCDLPEQNLFSLYCQSSLSNAAC